MLFFSICDAAFQMHEKPLRKSEGLLIFRRATNARGCEFPLPLCFSNTKGCALDRLLLCLHLCGLERNNGVVLREHHPITSPFIQASGRKKLSEHSGSVIGTGRLDLVLGKKNTFNIDLSHSCCPVWFDNGSQHYWPINRAVESDTPSFHFMNTMFVGLYLTV